MSTPQDKLAAAHALALTNLSTMSDEEDAAITAAAATDPDSPVLSDEEWERMRPKLHIGRPKSDNPKIHQGLRLSPDVLAYFKATGKGWQTRIDAALKEWIAGQKKGTG